MQHGRFSAEEVAGGLERSRREGAGWTVCCPAHDDRDPSLSIDDRSDGGLLVRCHAGCEQTAVIDALRQRGLWPDPGRREDTATTWHYCHEDGRAAFDVVRFPGKKIRPRLPDGSFKAYPAPRPLYRLPDLVDRPDAPVLVVEGEKAADAAARRFPGHVVTTSSGGSKAARKTDWEPLRGRDVTIWPDADQAGIAYAQSVRKILREHGTPARIVAVPDRLPEGWDLADLVPADLDVAALLRDASAAPSKKDEEKVRQGRIIEWVEPEPWPDPVDGAALLEEIASAVCEHVAIDDYKADAAALWCTMCWLHDKLDVGPFLHITAPTKRAGKSLLLEIVSNFVPRPLAVSASITEPALFRTIEICEPTFLLDEVDRSLKDRPELVAAINGSQKRSEARAIRLVEHDGAWEPRAFSTWCPKVFSGIGSLPDTVNDRAIAIRLERKPAGRSLPRWRDRDQDAVAEITQRIKRWIADTADSALARRSSLVFPGSLNDRQCDGWEPLLAVAAAAATGPNAPTPPASPSPPATPTTTPPPAND